MFFEEKVYKIFKENTEPEKRMEELKKLYDEQYASGTNKMLKWEVSKPLLQELVTKEFQTNTIASGEAGGGTNTIETFVHLEPELYHNKDLMLLLMALSSSWGDDQKMCRRRIKTGLADGLREFVEAKFPAFSDKLSSACSYDGADKLRKELVEEEYYYFILENMGRDKNRSNSQWGCEIHFYKVVIW